MRIAVLLLGIVQLCIGLLMVLVPGTFFAEVGPFGERNDHYIRDMASWELALGVAALLAVRRVEWRLPVLAFGALHYALHAVNHVVDVGESEPGWVGPVDLALLVVGAVLLAVLARRAGRVSGS